MNHRFLVFGLLLAGCADNANTVASEDEVAEVADEVESLQAQLTLMEDRLAQLEAVNLDARVATLEGANLDTRVAALEDEVDVLAATDATFAQSLSDIESSSTSLDGRLDNLEGRVVPTTYSHTSDYPWNHTEFSGWGVSAFTSSDGNTQFYVRVRLAREYCENLDSRYSAGMVWDLDVDGAAWSIMCW